VGEDVPDQHAPLAVLPEGGPGGGDRCWAACTTPTSAPPDHASTFAPSQVTLKRYLADAAQGRDPERAELLEALLALLERDELGAGEMSVDLSGLASSWIELIRPVWYERLKQPRRSYRPLQMQQLRSDLLRVPVATDGSVHSKPPRTSRDAASQARGRAGVRPSEYTSSTGSLSHHFACPSPFSVFQAPEA
jgi:hypothetical protein